MDFSLLTAVCNSSLPPRQRLILVLLLNHANKDGRAWPTHAMIARESGLCRRTVVFHMLSLERSGWIRRVDHIGKVGVFTIANPAVAPASALPVTPAAEPDAKQQEAFASQGANDASARVQMVPSVVQTAQDQGANDDSRCANDGAPLCSPFRQTTQEPINNHPERTNQEPQTRSGEEGRPPLEFEKSHSWQKKPVPPKPDWREVNRHQSQEANAIPLSPGHPRDFVETWQRYREYRTWRATEVRVASDAVAWTAAAAMAALDSCEAYAQTHGWPAVAAHLDNAIGGHWRGLNLPAAPAPSPPPPQVASF